MQVAAVLILASALAAAALGSTQVPSRIFPVNSESVYKYVSHVSAGTAEPREFLSHFSIQASLRVQTIGEKTKFKLEDVSFSTYNGEGNKHKLPQGESTFLPAPVDAKAINKPFVVVYADGKVTSFEYETTDTLWSRNLKRSIASQFQIELKDFSFDLPRAFSADEGGISGDCKVENDITSGDEPDTYILRKSQDAARCKGPRYWYDNVSLNKCQSEPKNPISTSTERTYQLTAESEALTIKKIRSRSVTSFQPLWVKGELQYLFVNQTFVQESSGPIGEPLVVQDTTPTSLSYEFQDSGSGSGPDMLFERYSITSEERVANVEKLLIKTADNLNEDPEEDAKKLYDASVFSLIAFMRQMDQQGLRKVADFAMLGTTYKDDSIKQLFTSVLPKIGTHAAVLLIRDLVINRELDAKQSLKVLVDLPFHLRFPTTNLLKECNEFLNLEANLFDLEVRKTAVLTFASMVGKVCQSGICPPAILDEYVKILFTRLREATDYDEQLTYVQAMGNVRVGPVASYLEPIIRGKLNFTRQLRFLAVWAVSDELVTNPEKTYDIFWPILADRRNELELRIAALTMLLTSQPTTERFMNVLWFMVSDPSYQLYQFFYTTIVSLSNTKFPCYSKLSTAAQQIKRMVPKLTSKTPVLTTSNEILDFVDPDLEMGKMYQLIMIGSERSDVADIVYLHADKHVRGQVYNSYSIYLRTEGFNDIKDNKVFESNVGEDGGAAAVLQALYDKLKVRRRKSDPVHVELVVKVQGRTVISLYLNETGIERIVSIFQTLQRSTPLSQHLNYQTLEQAAFTESIFPSDLGTAVAIESSTLPLMNVRGNLNYNFKPPVVAVNVSLDTRVSVRRSFGLRVLNPLSALWHGMHRPSVQILTVPIDFDLSFDVVQKTFKARLGWTKGKPLLDSVSYGRSQVFAIGKPELLKATLPQSCPQCSTFTPVTPANRDEDKTKGSLETTIFEDGIDVRLSKFDCDNMMDVAGPFIKPLFLQRFSNYGFPEADFSNYLSVAAMQSEMLASLDPLLNSCGRRFSITPTSASSGLEFIFKAEGGKDHKRLYRLLLSVLRADGSTGRSWDANVITEGNEQETRFGAKIKVVAKQPGESSFVTCIKADNIYPERGAETYWDQLGQPYESRKTEHHVVVEFGEAEDGKCPAGKGPRFEVTATTDHQGLDDTTWPLSECLEQRRSQNYRDSKGNLLFPATHACAMASWGPRPRNVSMTFAISNVPGLEKLTNNQIGADLIKVDGQSVSFGLDAVHALSGDSVNFKVRSKDDREFKVPLPFKEAPYIVSESLAHYPAVDNLKMAMDLIHPCLIAGGRVLTFDNASLPFTPQPEFTLISGVCTDDSPFAVFAKKTDGADALTLRVFLDGIEFNVEPSNGQKSKVTISDGLQAKELKALGIRVSQVEKGKVDIRHEKSDFYIRNTDSNLGVLVPEKYERYYCGVCGDSNKVPEYSETLGPQGDKISVNNVVNAYTLVN